MSLAAQLTDYINAAFSGLWVQTQEPDEAEREVLRLARDSKWKIAIWDVASGLCVPGASGTVDAGAGDPLAALRALSTLAERNNSALLILHNFHRFLFSPLCGSRHKGFYVVNALMWRRVGERPLRLISLERGAT